MVGVASIDAKQKPREAKQDLRELAAIGIPMHEGKPDDPMLAFLDL